jgi:hypothetical protein
MTDAKDTQAGTSTREERILTYTSIPVPQWFFHENSLWHPYSEVISSKLEDTNKDHTYMITIDDYQFDLAKMSSFKKGASKQKHLRRGTWFYKVNGNWVPYDQTVCTLLESKWQKGEFKQPVLINNENPKKFVEFKNNTFSQFKPNKPQATKEVQRGWNGMVRSRYTETISIITTVTRDSIIAGPGEYSYTKPLQPGVPFLTVPKSSPVITQTIPIPNTPLHAQSVPSNGQFGSLPQSYPQQQQVPGFSGQPQIVYNPYQQQQAPPNGFSGQPQSMPNGPVFYPMNVSGDGITYPQPTAPPNY